MGLNHPLPADGSKVKHIAYIPVPDCSLTGVAFCGGKQHLSNTSLAIFKTRTCREILTGETQKSCRNVASERGLLGEEPAGGLRCEEVCVWRGGGVEGGRVYGVHGMCARTGWAVGGKGER